MATPDTTQDTQPNPHVQKLIAAAQVGATIDATAQTSRAAVVAPAVAPTVLPAIVAKAVVVEPLKLKFELWKIGLILKALGTFQRKQSAKQVDWLTAYLRREFPDLDPAVIRRAVDAEARVDRAFAQNQLRRAEQDLRAAESLPTPEARKKRTDEIVKRERWWAQQHAKAALARAVGACQAETVRIESPRGARWMMGQAKNHTPACRALHGKVLPWDVLDIVGAPPGPHTGCKCSLEPIGPEVGVPMAGEALAMARAALALDEALVAVCDPGEYEAALAGEPVRPVIERALRQLQEGFVEGQHARGRSGEWIRMLGTLTPEGHHLGFQSGASDEWGRGLVAPDGTVHTWPEGLTDARHPSREPVFVDHSEMAKHLGIASDDSRRHFRISPRGRVTASSSTDPALLQHVLHVTGLTAGNYREEASLDIQGVKVEPRPEPGATPIPKDHVRLWHYTSAPPEVVRHEGLKLSAALGETYGEPNQIWASATPPSFDNHNVVEFHVPLDDPRWNIGKFEPGTNYDYPDPMSEHPEESYIKYLADRGAHVTFRDDIKPSEVIAVHEPWQTHYRYLMDAYPDSTTAKPDEFDWALDANKGGGPDLAKAVAEWKKTVFGSLQESIFIEGQHARGRGGKWIDMLRQRHPHVEIEAKENEHGITLSMLRVAPGKQRGGLADAALTDLLAHADAVGKPVALTPEPVSPRDPSVPGRSGRGASKTALASWYRKRGFVPNKGRNKDWAFREAMVRPPQTDIQATRVDTTMYHGVRGAIPHEQIQREGLKPHQPGQGAAEQKPGVYLFPRAEPARLWARGGNVYAVQTAGLPLSEDPRMSAIFSPEAIAAERLSLHSPEGTYDPFGDEGNTTPFTPKWRRSQGGEVAPGASWEGVQNPSSQTEPWYSGQFGKGSMVDGVPYVWKTQAPDFQPWHMTVAGMVDAPDTGRGASARIIVLPNGHYGTVGRDTPEARSEAQGFASADGRLSFVSDGPAFADELWKERQRWQKANGLDIQATQVQPAHGIGDSLIPPKSGKVKQIAGQTLPILDGLLAPHPLETPIPIKAIAGKNKRGSFGRDLVGDTVVPSVINVSTAGPQAPLTLAHEVGHLVDNAFLGTPHTRPDGKRMDIYGSMGAAIRDQGGMEEAPEVSQLDPTLAAPWDAWWKATKDSPEYEKLGSGSYNEIGTLQYLRQPVELFARAFAQWTATHSDDPAMKQMLDDMRDPVKIAAKMKPVESWRNFQSIKRPRTPDEVPDHLVSRQWSDQTFEPIDQALTSLFQAYGILRETSGKTTSPLSEARLIPSSSPTTSSSLTENLFSEILHPRGRGGRWVTSGKDAPPDIQAVGTDYRGWHTAPSSDYGSPMHDMTRLMPDDFYDKTKQLRFYGTGDATADRESLKAINAVHGKPDAMVTMHRAVPAAAQEILPGDWVTPSRSYADQHAQREENTHVISKQVPARELWTNHDSLNEFGWQPTREHELGITPYRGTAPPTAAYFRSTRYKGFENRLRATAEREHVEVHRIDHVTGVWAGSPEPSARVLLRDGIEAVRRVADDAGGAYDQDAVLRFRANPDGKAVRYLSDKPVGAEAVKQALSGKDMGGTVLPDGRLEMIDLDGSQANDMREVMHELGATFGYTHGDGELRSAGTDYQRASAARASAAVRESAAAPDEPGGSPARGRDDPDVHPEALAEGSFYDEVLHPRDRLGRWMEKQFGEVQAKDEWKGGEHRVVQHQDARWTDQGQNHEQMVRDAVTLLHPAVADHAEIVKAVMANTTPSKGSSKEVKATVKKLRDAQNPKGLRGKWLVKLHATATENRSDAHVQHIEAVADSVSEEAKPVAIFHDTHLSPEELTHTLTEKGVMDAAGAHDVVAAVGHLAQRDGESYDAHVERIRTAEGKSGDLAREVKRASLQHDLGRKDILTGDKRVTRERALQTLAPERKPITQRGRAVNVGKQLGDKKVEPLDEEVVMARLEKLWAASEKSGDAEIERHWYHQAHDQIAQLAEQHHVDPYVLAGMVAATSPQMAWKHDYKDGHVEFKNLDLAIHAAELATKYQNEPAPKLVDRLVAEAQRRAAAGEKGPSELGGLGESILKAVRIYRGEDPERVLNAPKTRSFLNNMAFPDRATTVTLDEHAARAALGLGKQNYSKSTQGVLREADDAKSPDGVGDSGYAFLANIYKKLAEQHGVLPHQAQAIVWVAQKKIADEMDAERKAAEKAAKA